MALRVVVHNLGERRTEALEVHATLVGEDVVRKGERVLREAGVPLHGNFDLAALVLIGVLGALALDVDGTRKAGKDRLVLVEELDEVHDAACVAELVHTRGEFALVNQRDLEVLVQEGSLLKAVMQGVIVIDRGLKDELIGPEGDGGTGGL